MSFLSWKEKGDYAEGREREREMHRSGEKRGVWKSDYGIKYYLLI